jgi:Ser/Thr protein kinase RdoA (MazF antagonist)
VEEEQPLAGGNLSAGVVRVGDTVRRPTGPWTPAVHALLAHLEAKRFAGAPRLLGLDDQGREILEYIDGEVAWPDPSNLDVARVGRMLRAYHDAVADFVPPANAAWRFPAMAPDAAPFADGRGFIVCHNDPAAWNLVVHDDRLALIDWDTAGPRPPIWDVAYFVASIMRLPGAARRLRALADGYDLSAHDRARLPEVVVARITSSYEHMRRRAVAKEAPWDQMWEDGHGDAWAQMRAFAEQHAAEWQRALTA